MKTIYTHQSISIQNVVKAQRAFFRSGTTRELKYRIKALKSLKSAIKAHEEAIFDALTKGLQKPKFETYSSEIGLLYEDINLMLKSLRVWSQPKLKSTGISNFPAKSYIYPEPYGVSLIIGAWNYPIMLVLQPLIGAIAAGNTAIVKPSELAPASSSIVASIIQSAFKEDYVNCIEGGVEVSQELLGEKFDFIFFTGSTKVGKIVNKAAAEHLTPVVLELGGKSPCIVDESADIKLAARRIAWGKFFNAGQSCIAPDYVLVHESKQEKLVAEFDSVIKEFYGENPQLSRDFGRIVNKRHFDRLVKLMEGASIFIGGSHEEEFLYISPTIVEASIHHPLMKEEIFGPILPMLTFESLEKAIDIVYQHPNPLALYMFSTKYKNQQKVINSLNFGGGCINDTMAHFINNQLPFGGIGNSGIGQYHGKYSFETFSHNKSILHKVAWPDIPLRYPPYKGKLPLIKRIVK